MEMKLMEIKLVLITKTLTSLFIILELEKNVNEDIKQMIKYVDTSGYPQPNQYNIPLLKK